MQLEIETSTSFSDEPHLPEMGTSTEYSYGNKTYSFKDPVCQGVVKEADSVKCCKKTFCKLCLDEALKRSSACPLCRTANPVVYENDAIDNLVNNLQLTVLCLHHGKGCEWRGHLLHEPQHREDKSGYEEEACENRGFGCEVVSD